jgi:glycerol-1-phosphatase
LRLAVRERGLRPVSTAAEHPLAVVEGFAPGIAYANLSEGGLAVRAGALFVGTNADSTIPSPRGIGPGNGSLLQVIAHATGVSPIIAGKPEPPLHRESVIRTGAKNPLVVGDRLDTDIEAAHNDGADSLLVLTGVSRPAELPLAPPRQRPTYIAETLDALLHPYPEVTRAGDGFACGGWTALRRGSGQFGLKGGGAPIDGLRALCAAAWEASDGAGHLTAQDIDTPLGELGAAGLRL